MKLLLSAPEGKLLELVTGLKENGSGHYFVLFHLSRLQEHYRSDYQLKIAVNVLQDLFRDTDATVALTQDSDVVLMYPGNDRGLIEKAIFQLRYLFVDDPLAYDMNGEETKDFCEVYDLGFQWRDVQEICRTKFMGSTRNRAAESSMGAPAFYTPPRDSGAQNANSGYGGANALQPINLSRLAMIEGDLRRADLSQAFRRQPICIVMRDGSIRPVFEEIYVNIPHLRKLVGMQVDFTANKGLFKYLTECLDLHVLSVLGARASLYMRSPVSININVETILSTAFAEFDQRVKMQMKPSLILEISVADVFADMNAYIAARNLAHNLGYRICIDGLTRQGFTQLDRQQLDFDLIKLLWSADSRAALAQVNHKPMEDAVKRIGPARVVLCRCDSPQAIEYGQGLGITMFQGRHTDKMVDPVSQVIN
jgi:EAL domain-containing protein (putative c-di-GMP-specific phosphodiesterase class I)